MKNDLEPLPPRVDALLRALPPPPAPPSLAQKASVGARIAKSVALPAAGAVAVAGGSALLRIGLPMAVAGLVLGAGGMAAIDRIFLPPEPVVIVEQIAAAPPPSPVSAVEPIPVPLQVASVRAGPPTLRITGPSSEERQLIEVARTALIKHEPLAALDAAASHRKRFARGQLAEERDSLEVQALAQAGRREEAKTAARAFLTRYQSSIFGPAVEAANSP